MELKQTGIVVAQAPFAPRPTRTFGPHRRRRIYLFIFALVIGEIASRIKARDLAIAIVLPRKSRVDGLHLPSLSPLTNHVLGLADKCTSQMLIFAILRH